MVYEIGGDKTPKVLDSEDAGLVINSTSWGSGEYTLGFFMLTMGLRPNIVVECGVYEGFVTYWVASALKCLGKGKMYSYDLWEDYPYTHCEMKVAERNTIYLRDQVELRKKDAWTAHNDFEDNSVDLLIVDISNDGNVYREFLFNWYPKLTDKSIVLMEGGLAERDEVEWMKKYKKEPILKTLRTNPWILSHYNYGTTGTFPSLTIFTKKEF